MALSIPEKIAQAAEIFCADNSHGYSQPARAGDGTKVPYKFSDGTKFTMDGGDIDCSELDKDCINVAFTGDTEGPIEYMWTGNQDEQLRALGFQRLTYSKSAVRRGDILWRSGHTGVALGDGRQAEAACDENGGISGGRKGDQTGYEVRVTSLSSNWAYIYRYPDWRWYKLAEKLDFTFSQQTNVRTSPVVRSDNLMSAKWAKGDTAHFDGIAICNGYVWGTYIGPTTGMRLYSVICSIGHWYGVIV